MLGILGATMATYTNTGIKKGHITMITVKIHEVEERYP
jgi:hypothetical protein